MNALQRGEMFKRYQRTWRRAHVLSLAALLAWAPVWAIECIDFKSWAFLVLLPLYYGAPFFYAFFTVSPMLAWFLARRHLPRCGAPDTPSQDAYRATPKPRYWPVSGSFPRWAAVMCIVGLPVELYWRLLRNTNLTFYTKLTLHWEHFATDADGSFTYGDIGVTNYLLHGPEVVANVLLLYLWWRAFRGNASRAGVIEQTNEGGSQELVLHTSRESRPVTVARMGLSPRVLRVDAWGSREVWHAFEPVNDLVRLDAPHAAARRQRRHPC